MPYNEEEKNAPTIGSWVRVFTLDGKYLGLGILKEYYLFYIPELDKEVLVPRIRLNNGETIVGIDFWWREWKEGESESDIRRLIEKELEEQ